MLPVTVLLLESERNNGSSFALHLKKRYHLLVAHSGKQALELAKAHQPDVVVLDAASMRTSGDRLCLTLRNTMRETPLIHIKPGPVEKEAVSTADVLMYMPFTYRKLCNRIDRFAANRDGHVLSQGVFRLNVQQHILTTPTGDQKLTPKLAKLMEVLMKNVNQVVERRELIKQVWETDYMGDTRTLDVHIRWIRQAVEPDPNHPQYIKTVRGKGYMLVIPD